MYILKITLLSSFLFILIGCSTITNNLSAEEKSVPPVKAINYAVTINGEKSQDNIVVQVLIFDQSDNDKAHINFYSPNATIPNDSITSGRIIMNLAYEKLSLILDLLRNEETIILNFEESIVTLSSGKQVVGDTKN